MNPDFPTDPRQALETSLTALLLGELPPEQARFLRQTIATDAELARTYERLRQTIALVHVVEATPVEQTAPPPEPLKLSAERRERLLQEFKTVKPKEFARPRRRVSVLVPLSIAAVLVLFCGVLILPNFIKARTSGGSSFRTSLPAADAAVASKEVIVNGIQDVAANDVAREPLMRRLRPRQQQAAPATPARAPALAFDSPSAGNAIVGAPSVPATLPSKPPQMTIVLPPGSASDLDKLAEGRGRLPELAAGGTATLRGFYDDNKASASSAETTPTWSADGSARNFFALNDLKRGGAAAMPGGLGGGAPAAPKDTAGRLSLGTTLQSAPLEINVAGTDMAGGRKAGDAELTKGIELGRQERYAAVPGAVDPATGLPKPHEIILNGISAARPAIDPATGLPVAAVQPAAVDPASGLPLTVNKDEEPKAPVLGSFKVATNALVQAESVAGFDWGAIAQAPGPGGSGLGGGGGLTGGVMTVPRVNVAGAAFGGYGGGGGLGGGIGGLGGLTNVALVPLQWTDNMHSKNGNALLSASTGPQFSIDPEHRELRLTDLGIAETEKVPILGDKPAVGKLEQPANVPNEAAALDAAQWPMAKREEISNKENYRGRLLSRMASPEELSSAQLSNQLTLQEQDVKKTQAQVDQLREKLGVQEMLAAGDAPSMILSAESLRRVDQLRIESQAELRRQRADLEKLNSVKPDELAQGVPKAAAGDAVLSRLLEQSTVANRKLAALKGQSNANGAEIGRAQSNVEELNRHISDRLTGLKLGTEAKISSLQQSLTNLQSELARAQLAHANPGRTGEYWKAKRKLEELQRERTLLYTKMAMEGTETNLPRSTMVEIVDQAVPSAATPSLTRRFFSGQGSVEAKARIKLERDQTDIASLMGPQVKGGSYDPYFIQTEFEVIQSEQVLGKVIDKLNLSSTWAKTGAQGALTRNETLQMLRQRLDLKRLPNSSLVEIGVKDSNPQEAAKLANAVAEAYRDQRLEHRKQLSDAGLQALKKSLDEQEQKVAAAQQEVDRLRLQMTNAPADAAPAKPATPVPTPQPEVQTSENAFSTFSLNVSDVSFKLAAASLEKGQMPDPASIRSEEFINAFDYRDPEAPPGVPIAFAWERARYPFAQNRDLLRFSLKTAAQGRQAGRPLNLVLLLDNSGSMERADRVSIIHEALRVLAAQLQPQDTFSIVTFAIRPRLWVDGVPGNQAAQAAEEVSKLTPQGGTNLEEAMNLAYQTALRHYLANGVNRVVLLTDGAANLGSVDPDALKQKVETNRKQGIALDCFGIGWEGYNDDLLEVLSRNGDGRYGFINTPEEATTEFAGQLAGALHVAASDVKVQVEFNPARVTAYRQIGYAKHQLTKEQFRDNTVDAAEIGAAESGNALYVVEVNGGGEGPLAIVRVRYKIPSTADYREQEWAVPFNGSAVALEQASPALRLAATASAISEWLAGSPYATEVTPDALLGYLRGVPEIYGADARPKKLEWMLRQAKSVAGAGAPAKKTLMPP